jgi:TusA-related sulfurtransferase
VSEDTRRFVETCCGDIEGWLCVAVGREPYRDDNGKYKHHKWDEVAFRWPAEADKAIDYITRASALGDVYTCPYPMKEMRRAKGQAARRVLIHADVDGDLDEAEVSRLGGFIVNSGSPGHGHVYVPLAWPVTPDQHEALCRGLAAHLGGDTKYSDNDLLRAPGTWNYKSKVDGRDPNPVAAVWCGNGQVDPRDIAGLIGVDLANPATTNGHRHARAEQGSSTVNLARYPSVLAALTHKTEDRSQDTYRIVAACRSAGLTLAETTWSVRSRDDLRERLDERKDDDLLAVWLKLDDEQRTATRVEPPSAAAHDGTELLDAVYDQLTKFVVFPDDSAAVAAALWIAATHALPAWQHATRLIIRSPQKRCGKSRLLDIVALLCFEPLMSTDASVAAIYRSIGDDDHQTPTLLIDEVDALFGTKVKAEQNDDLRGLLNAGWQRGRSARRCVGPNQTPTDFPTFAMCALAGIRGVPDTVADRGVTIDLKRRLPGESVARFRGRRDTKPLLELRAQLTAWAREGERLTVLADAEPAMPDDIEDRLQDAWEPLVAIAEAAGAHWPDLARAACLELCGQQETDDLVIQLLADIETIFSEVDLAFLGSTPLVRALKERDESPWQERDSQLTTHKLARMLKDFGVSPRYGPGGSVRGYWRDDFTDPFLRYNCGKCRSVE